MALVTVALPVFNGMPHLPTAVESVLNQTHEDLELVIIDDGSTDDTPKYLATLDDPRVRLDPNPHNLGVQGAWDRALDQAERSPFFKLMCADDLLYPSCIATHVAAMQAYPEVVMATSRRTIINDRDETVMKARGLPGMSGVVPGRKAVRRSVMWGTNVLGEPTSVLLRSEALKGLRFDATHKLCIDFDMWAQVLQRGDLYATTEPLSAFRVGVLSDSLATVSRHRQMHIGEFRKLSESPEMGITKPVLYAGIAMTYGVTTARQVFYKYLDVREKLRSRSGPEVRPSSS